MCTDFMFPPPGLKKDDSADPNAKAKMMASYPISGRTMDFMANLAWQFASIKSTGVADDAWKCFPAVNVASIAIDLIAWHDLHPKATPAEIAAELAKVLAAHPTFGAPAVITPPATRTIQGISIDLGGVLTATFEKIAKLPNVTQPVVDALLKALTAANESFSGKVIDALNDKGLSGAALWSPASEYPHCPAAGAPVDPKVVYISAFDIVRWGTSLYDDVPTLRAALQSISDGVPVSLSADGSNPKVVKFWNPGQEFSRDPAGTFRSQTPLHFSFHDREHHCVVLEFRGQKMDIYDHTNIGVMTNRPFLDWHVENLGNYLLSAPLEVNSRTIVHQPVDRSSNGCGFGNIPGSGLSPHRFVRTVLNVNNSIPIIDDIIKTYANDETLRVQTLLTHATTITKNVTVPRGQVIENHPGKPPGIDGDWTQWEVVRDHQTCSYYISTPASMGYWPVPAAWISGDGLKITALPSLRPAATA